jgi:hypothetical protein
MLAPTHACMCVCDLSVWLQPQWRHLLSASWFMWQWEIRQMCGEEFGVTFKPLLEMFLLFTAIV